MLGLWVIGMKEICVCVISGKVGKRLWKNFWSEYFMVIENWMRGINENRVGFEEDDVGNGMRVIYIN